MNTRRRPILFQVPRAALTVLTAVIALGGALLGAAGSAFGQSSAPAPTRAALPELPASAGAAASAPRVGPLAPARPRPRSLSEAADQASPPGELRPERPVTPQLSIPLGRTPPAAAPGPGRSVRPAAATPASGGVDDAAARSESLEGSKQRSACQVRVERALPTRLTPAPN